MKFREFNVLPNLPASLKPLLALSYNIWWAWDPEAFAVYRDIDPDLWSDVSHNPVKFMHRLPQEKLDSIAADEGFLYRIDAILKRLDTYMKRPTWYEKIKNSLPNDFLIAYFSLEFGLAECLPIYSGGLGVLAGDHLKSASDLGMPLIAVGLLYSEGYFHQYLSNDGWQHEWYEKYDFNIAPVSVVKNPDNSPLTLDLKLPHATVKYQVWKVQVGRITLYLLDTNLPDNAPADKEITSKLYGGDLEMRIKQEFLLGIGGMQALTALNINPSVTHMNEGHSSFLSLERIKLLMQKNNLTFNEAKEVTAASSVFTTHTPVPAGNDRFPQELMEKYMKEYVENNLKISFDEFLRMGRVFPDDMNEWFCMTVLALKLSHHNNGVSKLHGHVSRGMWKDIWTGVPVNEVPITHITNGTHGPSWISKEIADLFTRYLGPKWLEQPDDQAVWKRAGEIPDIELWRTHERRRERLVGFVRKKVKKQLLERKAPAEETDRAAEILSPDALTIGFARRFATYKRATLMFRDIERLKRIICSPGRPVQIIFAGKAHPKDDAGKEFIKQVFHTALGEDFRDKIVFLENYDLNTAHYLVQGVDVWMNNPRRPLEASGTSGMKVNFNGGLNFSILDGWWAEKPDADNGWIIGRGEEYEDTSYQDSIEANSLYETLENEIIPLFYKRGKDNLPHDWIKKMKTSMQTLCPVFNTDRMVMEYTEKFYKPAGLQNVKLSASNFERAKQINMWKDKISKHWAGVNVAGLSSENYKEINVGGSINVQAVVDGAGLAQEDLLAEVYYGYDRAEKDLADVSSVKMHYKENKGDLFVYEGKLNPVLSGKIRFTVRVLPQNPDLPVKFMPGFIKWSEI
jgi:starch phosphorylase